ncbi:MAG: hypothetical protein C4543_10985 [Ignavibacteriales bacterium]|jgi:hypothetical protein|nr:MAG: hypothetical protein C4543_10985 [Ignavibacteriales bacterium]
MTTLPPPSTNFFPEDSLEKKVYNIVEKYSEFIPIPNDRNRLGFNLYKFMTGEGDAPEICVKNAKLKLVGITHQELANKLSEDLKDI